MKKYNFVIIIFIIAQVSVTNAASHYKPNLSGNPFNPMSILITNISVDNQNLSSGDEIGVFDGDVCVGSAFYKDNGMIGISVSMDDLTDSGIDGFKPGNRIYFRIWKQNLDFEYTSVQTNFDLSFDTIFNPLGTAIVELKTSISGQKPKIYPNQLFSVPENATQNLNVGVIQIEYSPNNIRFELINRDQYPFIIDSISGTISVTNNKLLKYIDTKKYLLSIRAYCQKNSELSDTSICIVNVVGTPLTISEISGDTAIVGIPYNKKVRINNPIHKQISVVPINVPTWLTIDLKDDQEIIFGGIPGKQDVGQSKVCFLLSDEANQIEQSYLLETVTEEDKNNVVIYNNPTSGPFRLLLDKIRGDKIEVIIREVSGGIVYSNIFMNAEQEMVLSFDLSGSRRNTYIVEVKNGTSIIPRKLVLQ